MRNSVEELDFETKKSLKNILDDIKNGNIALPFFQRTFEWTTNDMKSLLVSLFLGLPIGSFLILEDDSGEFSTRSIEGVECDTNNATKFLLDGQQRLTSLFSIYNKIDSDYATIRRKLMQRWFVDINLFLNDFEDDVRETFKYNLQNFEPEDVENYFIAKENNSKNITYFLSEDDVKFVKLCRDEKIIPLDLFYRCHINTDLEEKVTRILAAISQEIISDLSIHIPNGESSQLNDIAETWRSNVRSYIDSILNIKLPILQFKHEQFSRAIQAFEILNKSGLKLHVFDLLVARAGRVVASNETLENQSESAIENFYNIVSNKYKEKLTPQDLKNLRNIDEIEEVEWSISFFDGNGSPSKIYKDMIVNILNLLISKEIEDKYVLSKNYLFTINVRESSEKLNMHIEEAMILLQRATAFMQFRCGIRGSKDIHYKLSILPIAVHMNDEVWNDKIKLNLIEAWYWSAIFTGRYEYNQSEVTKNEINNLSKILEGNKDLIDIDHIMERNEDKKEGPYFFDKMDLEYFKNCFSSSGFYKTILQFIINKNARDFLTGKKLKAWAKDSGNYEEHHIMPIKSHIKFKESAKKVRKTNNPINSILNKTIISKESNREISDYDFNKYKEKIDDSIFSTHLIPTLPYAFNDSGEIVNNNFEGFLTNRYNELKTGIKTHIKDLLD